MLLQHFAGLVWYCWIQGTPSGTSVLPHPKQTPGGQRDSPPKARKSRYCQGLVAAVAPHQDAPCTSSQVARQDIGQSSSAASGQP